MMNPFYFVKRQQHVEIRRHLETRNRAIYSWHSGQELAELRAMKPEQYAQKTLQFFKKEWPLTLALALVITALSLASFQVFVVVASMLAVCILALVCQYHYLDHVNRNHSQDLRSAAMPLHTEGAPDRTPRFIPISPRLQRPVPRHYFAQREPDHGTTSHRDQVS